MLLFGLCGLIGAGKDTVADLLVQHYGFQKLSFAGPIKDVVSILFQWPRDRLEGSTEEDRTWRETIDASWSSLLCMEITPRKMLQMIGTNMFRQVLSPHFWTSVMESKLNELQCDRIVITDCRFLEEIELLRKFSGTVIRVERQTPSWKADWLRYVEALENNKSSDEIAEQKALLESKTHPSEYMVYSFVPDVQIHNDSTIDHLKIQVDVLMKFACSNLENSILNKPSEEENQSNES
jgi:hypothetical protein